MEMPEPVNQDQNLQKRENPDAKKEKPETTLLNKDLQMFFSFFINL